MTKVKELKICPKCKAELPASHTDNCPKCKFRLHPYENQNFGTPDYVNSQYRELIRNLRTTSSQADQRKEREQLDSDYVSMMTNMADQDKIECMLDATSILKTFMISSSSRDTMKTVVELGIRIGRQADALDKYIKAGGMTHGISEISEPPASEQDPDELGGAGDFNT